MLPMRLLFVGLLLCACVGNESNEQADADDSKAEVTAPYEEYHPNGALKIQGQLLDGERHGDWTSFYDNGLKWSENSYHKGQLNGKTKAYYPNGMLRMTGTYIDDEKRGEWRFFNEEGAMVKRMDFNVDPPAEMPVQ